MQGLSKNKKHTQYEDKYEYEKHTQFAFSVWKTTNICSHVKAIIGKHTCLVGEGMKMINLIDILGKHGPMVHFSRH